MTDTPPSPPPPGSAPPPPPPPVPPSFNSPPAGSSNSNNGMAVAALVLGILTFVCLGPIAGILAVVFGFLGLKKAKEMGGNGKGMATAGIVLGIVGTVLSIILLIVFVFAADKASDSISDSVKNWSGTADPSSYDLKVEKCGIDSTFDSPMMTIKVTNKTSVEKNYIFNYEFRSSSGALIDSGGSFPESIPANGSKLVEISSFEDTMESTVKCAVTSVENWFN